MLHVFAALAFIAIFFFKVPFPYIVTAAALGGLFMQRRTSLNPSQAPLTEGRERRIEVESSTGNNNTRPSLGHVEGLRRLSALWAIPMEPDPCGAEAATPSTTDWPVLHQAAFVTFGGAYAVLSYITDVAVSSGWLSTQQMLIGLGLAELHPRPLIMGDPTRRVPRRPTCPADSAR